VMSDIIERVALKVLCSVAMLERDLEHLYNECRYSKDRDV